MEATSAVEFLEQWNARYEVYVPDDIFAPAREIYFHELEYEKRVKNNRFEYGGRYFSFAEVLLDNGEIETVIHIYEPPTFYMGHPKSYELLYGKDSEVYYLDSLDKDDYVYYEGDAPLTHIDIAQIFTDIYGENEEPCPWIPVD